MMVVKDCPQCGTRLSHHEESCPKCADPTADGPSGKIPTIAQRPKSYKLQQILAAALTLISFMVAVYGLSANDAGSLVYYGAAGLIAGSIWYLIARFSGGKVSTG